MKPAMNNAYTASGAMRPACVYADRCSQYELQITIKINSLFNNQIFK